MVNRNDEASLSKFVIVGAAVATLLIETNLTITPISLDRFLGLHVIVYAALFYILVPRRYRNLFPNTSLKILALVFLAWSLISIIVNNSSRGQQLFGVFGRNTGFLTYIALLLLMIIIASIKSKALGPLVSKSLFSVGLLSTGYGLIQFLGLDPIPWTGTEGQITGLMGNTNFQSSLLGITSTATLCILLAQKNSFNLRVVYLSIIAINLFVILKTQSIQGFLVFGIGALVVLNLYLKDRSSKSVSVGVLACSLLSLVIFGLGILGQGPFARLLHTPTIVLREFYWGAGINMLKANPLFGFGYDSYGDYYRMFRSPGSIVDYGPELASDAAHNVFIDVAVNGGFPLLVIYCGLLGAVLISAVKFIKRGIGFDPYFTTLFSCWVAYVSQMMISINQISLAIWGWVLAGAIVSYEISTRELSAISPSQSGTKAKVKVEMQAKGIVAIFVGSIVGLIIALPPFLGSVGMRSAMLSRDPVRIESAALAWPKNVTYMIKATEIFRDNKLDSKSHVMALVTLEEFPNSFLAWRTLSTLPNATAAELAKAKSEMKRLDPHNPDLK
jgi:O-antigen ligase